MGFGSSEQQQNPLTIQAGLESSYMVCIVSAADLQTRIQTGRGNLQSYFTEFYRRFSELYFLSGVYLKNHESLHEKIDLFFKPGPITDDRAITGLTLFREYQRALDKERIIINKGLS